MDRSEIIFKAGKVIGSCTNPRQYEVASSYIERVYLLTGTVSSESEIAQFQAGIKFAESKKRAKNAQGDS